MPAALGVGAVAVVMIGLIGLWIGWLWAFDDIPDTPQSLEELWETRREASYTVLGADGTVLGVRGPRYGRPIELSELPAHLPQAFLAIEDQNFFQHDGVDRRAMVRAFVANLQAGEIVQGGSTLTMQLVKNLILRPDQTIQRKLQEMRLAMEIEDLLTKEQILELYLNRVYLGEGAFGVQAAAERYFNKPAAELTLQESAILAALPKAPSRLAPTDNLAAAQARAEDVLQAMMDAGYIDPIEYLAAINEPAQLAPDAMEGVNPPLFGHVFDVALARAQQLVDPDEAPILVIETTIRPELQRAAQSAVEAVLSESGEQRNAGEAALVAMDLNGAITALIGGRDYEDSQYNRAVQAERQPGSAFKPVVFAAGFEAGLDPASAFEDEPVDFEGWQPENYGGGYRGRITIADALKRSINTVAAQVGAQAGVDAVAEMAERLGITTALNPVPALALGAGEVRLIDLTAVYAVFANEGRRTEPRLITEIRSARNELLWEAEPFRPGRQVIEAEDARAMSTMLESVILDGTGGRARLPDRRAAGKTGTSQNSRDAWFVGYTGHMAAGVWVGNDDDAPMRDVTGGSLPADIWRRFMVEAHEGLEPAPLSSPAPRRRTAREETLAAFYSSLSSRFDSMLEPAAADGASPD
ncbi:MAG: transglycosylase domain-containing protein [Oceanicaulis sp.]